MATFTRLYKNRLTRSDFDVEVDDSEFPADIRSLVDVEAALARQFYDIYPRDYFRQITRLRLEALTDPAATLQPLAEEILVLRDSGEEGELKYRLTPEWIDGSDVGKAAKILIANTYHHAAETFVRLYVAHRPGGHAVAEPDEVESPKVQNALLKKLCFSTPACVSNDTLHLAPKGVLYFASALGLEEGFSRLVSEHEKARRLVVRLGGLGRIELTGALVLKNLLDDATKASFEVEVVKVPPPAAKIVSR